MRNVRIGVVALALAVTTAGCTGWTSGKDEPGAVTPPPPAAADPIRDRVRAMPLEDKIGQMVFAGVDGTEASAEVRRLIADDRVGGLILYKDNIESVEQTVRLLNGLKEANREAGAGRPPLLLGVDQEGGKVSRLPPQLEPFPSSRDVAKSGDASRARAIGEALGEELSALGFNVDFAPVLDVDSNPRNPVIGSRSFGSSASVVASYGVEEMLGLRAKSVVPVVKHFPGHGDTSVDSHLELPVVNKTADELRKLELVPFAEAIRSKADAVMIAHILLPKVDPDRPASMSPEVVAGLLRGDMGFDGVVMTDDMTMGAILKHHDLGAAAVQSAKAGCDIVLVAHEYANARLVLDALKEAARSGELPAESIDRSVYRILSLKERYGLRDGEVGPVDVAKINAAIRRATAKP